MAENWATAEGFFKCPVPTKKKAVPGIGTIWIYGLTSGEKDEYENKVVSFDRGDRQVRLTNARAILLQLTVRNQHGARIFSEKDIGRLAKLPAQIADPILDEARHLSGMAVAEMDELVKNSQKAEEAAQKGSDSE